MTPARIDGFGLVLAMFILVALYGLGAAIVPLATTESLIDANHRQAIQMRYAAEAGAELALDELGQVSDWSHVLSGRHLSRFPPTTPTIPLADGRVLDLRHPDPTSTRPGGGRVRNPPGGRWRLFLHASLDDLVQRQVAEALQVVVWIADDPEDGDGDPSTDGNGRLVLHAACFGPGLAQRAVRITGRRRASGWVEALSWETIR